MIDPLIALRAAILADGNVQDRLAAFEDDDAFVAEALVFAAGTDVAIERGAIAAALYPDPLGLDRLSGAPTRGIGWPAGNWLPTGVESSNGELVVDWAHFADIAPDTPFFEDASRRARARPFNRFMRHRTPLTALADRAPPALAAPDGLIFHLSRCGSTLVSQMLAALDDTVAVSEPAPLDQVVQIVHAAAAIPADTGTALLAAMTGAIGRGAAAPGRRYFLKLDSWHALSLPLFRAAFPETPWLFLYRDPVEVLVSQMRMRGLQTVPGMLPASIMNINGGESMPAEVYCAHVLERICDAAIDQADSGGLLVNYDELPDAMYARILPHFGIDPKGVERLRMEEAARRDAKSPDRPFMPDRDAKQHAASEKVRAAAAAFLAEPYRRLEALRERAG